MVVAFLSGVAVGYYSDWDIGYRLGTSLWVLVYWPRALIFLAIPPAIEWTIWIWIYSQVSRKVPLIRRIHQITSGFLWLVVGLACWKVGGLRNMAIGEGILRSASVNPLGVLVVRDRLKEASVANESGEVATKRFTSLSFAPGGARWVCPTVYLKLNGQSSLAYGWRFRPTGLLITKTPIGEEDLRTLGSEASAAMGCRWELTNIRFQSVQIDDLWVYWIAQ
jgi:hypothetical protein